MKFNATNSGGQVNIVVVPLVGGLVKISVTSNGGLVNTVVIPLTDGLVKMNATKNGGQVTGNRNNFDTSACDLVMIQTT